MPDETSADAAAGPLLGVMGAARVLGIATATLRSWERRYGLAPAAHTKGGHRRYSPADMVRLQAMGRMVRSGVPPAEAARACMAMAIETTGTRETGPGADEDPSWDPGRNGPEPGVQSQPGLQPQHLAPGRTRSGQVEELREAANPDSQAIAARGLARAAASLDKASCIEIMRRSLATHGCVATWDDLVRPVLSGIGARWAATGVGVEVEHALTAAVTLAFSEYANRHTAASQSVSVILASTPDELHDIPMVVLASALAERNVPALHLGARTPGRALGDALTRLRPAVLVLWSQDPNSAQIPPLPALRPAPALLLCGPGWRNASADRVVARSLSDAVNRVGAILRGSSPRQAWSGSPSERHHVRD